ncbi:ATP-binding cassette domain-containing protein [Streptomyces sp. NPDC018693]|uniref:ATP-binding cassette domain-containing protein n=1 Tax=unclassified Streptomyces TaxID=2593676 RepID=UPI0037A5A316
MTVTTATRTAARVVDAVKVYGRDDTEVRALDGVSVGFPADRFTAITGPSGSGKSTLMHCAAGLDALTSGTAHVGDTELGALDDRRLALLRRDRVGFVFQVFNLGAGADRGGGHPAAPRPRRGAGRRGVDDSLVDVVGLCDGLRHRPCELSGGRQQRDASARAFAARADVVFADEPTGNLTAAARPSRSPWWAGAGRRPRGPAPGRRAARLDVLRAVGTE